MIRDDFRAGEVLSASALNEIRAELRRLGKMTAAPPLHVSDDSAGFHFDLTEPEKFPIKILAGGSGGKYPWRGQDPVAGGGWADNARSGTLADDPACEASGNASVAAGTVILRAARIQGNVRFERACT